MFRGNPQMINEDYGNVTVAEPSSWDKLSEFGSDNKDILASLAGKYAQYEEAKSKNKAQGYVNEAAAKWSGFNPNLMNLVKPTDLPSPVGLAAEAFTEGPKFWYDIDKLYQARDAAKKDNNSKMEEIMQKKQNQDAIAAIGNTYGVPR